MKNRIIVVRGAGDLATGTIYELHQAGYQVLALECERPAAIRRAVCFSEAVYDGEAEVEGVTARRIAHAEEVWNVWKQGEIPVLVDADGESIAHLQPMAVVDLILAKKNLGTKRDMAPLVIGAGPGFCAGKDVDVVIETMRGYTPGKAIYEGSALPNTGIPGMVGGVAKERVIHAPAEGRISHIYKIGDYVECGEVIATIGDEPVYASLTGILRGLIREDFYVKKGMKIADIDPRSDKREACYKRSDKAIAIAKGILNVIEKQIRLQYLLQLDCEETRVIAVVGGGGKTSLIYELAEELASNGKRVIVTTTTHMMQPSEKEQMARVRTIGLPCAKEPGKIKGISEAEYLALKEQCDVLLVEADGSKRKPLKAPAEHEPVIPEDAELVIGIVGASAIGQRIETCCHRKELVSRVLATSEAHVVTEEDLVAMLKSRQGQKKNVKGAYRMVIGQADLLHDAQKEKLAGESEIILWSRRV